MQESGPGSGWPTAAQPMHNVATATSMRSRRKVPTPLIFNTEKTRNLSHRATSIPRKQPTEADGDFSTKHPEAAPEQSRATTAQEVDGNFTSTSSRGKETESPAHSAPTATTTAHPRI